MELILINSSKLKIMLSDDDMKKYDLDTNVLDYDATATKRAFWSILDDAKTETGFDAAGDKLFVQLYPSKKGGCEMYVTKMHESASSKKGGLQILPLGRNSGGREQTSAYAFDELSPLLAVCRHLRAMGYVGESSAYQDRGGRSFLILNRYGSNHRSHLDEFSFISEFGRVESVDRTKLYISEHADCICEGNAVERLGIL